MSAQLTGVASLSRQKAFSLPPSGRGACMREACQSPGPAGSLSCRMRSATLVQDLRCDVDEHWRLFLDEAFDRAQYLEALGFLGYETLERVETETAIVRRCRVTPPLDP